MANTRLSYSQVSRYTQCGESYRLHYIAKIKPVVQSAALLFGSAIDNALNDVLLNKGNAEESFEKSFTNAKVNGIETYLPSSPDIVYANTDYDADLLTEDDERWIYSKTQINSDQQASVFARIKKRKADVGFLNLTMEERVIYNVMNWTSLRQKGLLMIAGYRKKVMPLIRKVHAVQIPVSIKNEVGDTITGFADFVADIDYHGKLITAVMDNKTSAMEYEEDSVLTSPQLSLYTHALTDVYKTRYAGYVVLRKAIIKNRTKICSVCGYDGSGARHKTCSSEATGKRCGGEWTEKIRPEVNIQIIIDEIPPRTEEIVMDNMDTANEGIKAGIFTRNMHMCNNYFGGSCPYKDLCYKNKMTGLKKD